MGVQRQRTVDEVKNTDEVKPQDAEDLKRHHERQLLRYHEDRYPIKLCG